MSEHGFTRYRDLERPRPPEGRETSFDPVAARRRWLREGPPSPRGRYVLYWMQIHLRGRANAALEEAIRRANALELPLVVYQGLNPDYPEANDRIHRFILECARDVAEELLARGIRYVFHLRRERADARAVAAEMIRGAAFVVVDDFPTFILPGITRAALERTADAGVPVLALDANGVVPLAEVPERQYAARTIRPRLHRLLPAYLPSPEEPEPEPERDSTSFGAPARGIEADLRGASDAALERLVAGCEVDHSVPPSRRHEGGRRAALRRLERFVADDLSRYAERARDPGADATSGLSPYLHFGCLSAREVALRVLRADAPAPSVDAFLEEAIVRRELAYNFCRHTPVSRHTTLDPLPDWAKRTLAEHADDERDPIYSEDVLEAAGTHDEVWNAAQRELVATGTFHNYLRMLWGKQVIRWTPSYEAAQRFMIRMHHRYALDGRNPNTYANILWCFGLHDRAFAERPVLGKLRPLSSERTARKFDLAPYFERVERWASERPVPALDDG